MVVQSDLLNAIFTVLCCALPFCGFLIFIAILIHRSTKTRLKFAKEISEHSDDPIYLEKLLPVPRRFLPIYLTITWLIMCSLLGFILIMVAYYLDLPVVRNINSNTLGIVGALVLLVAMLATLAALIVMNVRKSKK